MSKVKSSPPLKKSGGSNKLIGAGIGCLIVAGILLVGVIAVVVIAGPGLSNFFTNGQAATASLGLDDKTSPETLKARREKEEAQLNSYGWVDKEAGLVRIPINQAIALVAESGLPVGSEEAEETTPTPAPTVESETPSDGTPIAGEAPAATSEPSGEESPTVEPTVPLAPTVNLAEVSFTQHVLPIFEQHCLKCHGGENPEGELRTEEGLSLKSYEDIMAGSQNGSVVEPGNIADSYLIEQITTGRMPKEGDPLLPTEIEIITAWVEAGAPNN
jgi:hypothetical protein